MYSVCSAPAMAARYSASISRTSARSPSSGNVLATATSTTRKVGAKLTGHGVVVLLTGVRSSPVADFQRARANSPMAAAALPSTAVVASCQGP